MSNYWAADTVVVPEVEKGRRGWGAVGLLAGRGNSHARTINLAIKELSHTGEEDINVNISMAMSDLSKTSILGLLLSILRNSVIILKYLCV